MAAWPCSNPNCNSHGSPHPNCRCAPPMMMADGGDTDDKGFCASNGNHDASCEYAPNPAADAAAAHVSGANSLFAGSRSYHKDVKRGHKAIKNKIESLFDGSSEQVKPDIVAREKLHKYIEGGGLNTELMSQEIKDNPDIPMVQNAMLNASKGRVFNYLNNLKPIPEEFQSKLAFDQAPVDKQKQHAYHQALDIAHDPLSVLNHAGNNTLLPDHISHLAAMYPDLNDHLQGKLTEHITKAQMNKEKPSYSVRQGLSMLMNVPMDSTLTPAAMQAIQTTFSMGKTQQAAAPQPKKNTKELNKASDSMLTGDQAAARRSQRPD